MKSPGLLRIMAAFLSKLRLPKLPKLPFFVLPEIFKKKPFRIAFAVMLLLLVFACAGAILMHIGGRGRYRYRTEKIPEKTALEALMERRSGLEERLGLPLSKEELAQMLLFPDTDNMDWPFALNRRVLYTDEDLDEMLPDLGAIDVSEMTNKRKAELEAIYNAVD